ncbi:MAG: hypothetical protein JW862_17405 [Anaerolineales bacterium]|nr:hypothetical protein [Anaerolineales bacterium]
MSRDLRRYARNTNLQLLAGFILILFLVGGSLIYWIYGPQAAILGLLCLVAGLAPLGLIAVVLWLMEKVVERANTE